jgi:MFS family permease
VHGYFPLIRSHPHFLAFGALLCGSASFGQTWFVSLFGAEIRGQFGLTHGDFGEIYSFATLASGISIIWLGRIIDHVSLAKFSAAVFVGLGVSAFGMAYCLNALLLGVVIFGLRLCGQGLLTHTATTSMARFFDTNRGKAISVATLGFPISEAFMPLTVVAVTATIGWRNSWLVWATLTLVVLLPLTLLLLHRSRYLWSPDERSSKDAERAPGAAGRTPESSERPASTSASRVRPARSWTRGEVVRDTRFHLMLPYLLAPAFISTGVMFHQVHLVETKGWSLQWFATGFIAYGAAKVVGSLVGGPLVDRYSARSLFSTFLMPMAVGVAILGVSDHPFAAIAFLGLTGVTNGLSGPIGGAFWAEVYGPRHLGAIRAMAVAIMVLGSALSPAVFGWLFDAGIDFSVVLYGSTVLAFVSTVLSFIALRRTKETV